jgi:hypothetical protein
MRDPIGPADRPLRAGARSGRQIVGLPPVLRKRVLGGLGLDYASWHGRRPSGGCTCSSRIDVVVPGKVVDLRVRVLNSGLVWSSWRSLS